LKALEWTRLFKRVISPPTIRLLNHLKSKKYLVLRKFKSLFVKIMWGIVGDCGGN